MLSLGYIYHFIEKEIVTDTLEIKISSEGEKLLNNIENEKLFEEDIKQIVFWTMGSLGNSNAYSVGLLLITACLGVGVTTHFKRELNILSLGEERAENLGVSVHQVRLLLLILASVMTGVAVSIAGGVAFVGLIVPHFSRKLFGANYDVLIPSVIFNGAIF